MKGRIIQRAELYLQKEGEKKVRHIEHWPDFEVICAELKAETGIDYLDYKNRIFLNEGEFPEIDKPITEWPESPEPPEPPELQTPLLGDYSNTGVRDGMTGRTDIPRLIAALKQMGATDYMHQVWQHAYQWWDFLEMAPEFQKAGIRLWLYNVPPSEPPSPKPFEYDYVRWAEEVARLMVKYPVIQGMLMDDFNGNTSYFTLEKCQQFIDAAHAIAPSFKFIPVAYFGHDSTYNIGSYLTAGICDALLLAYYFPHQNHTDTQYLRPQIEQFRAWINSHSPTRRVPLLPFIYGISVGGAPSAPTPTFVKECLAISLQTMRDGLTEGVAIYCLPKNKPVFIQAVSAVYKS